MATTEIASITTTVKDDNKSDNKVKILTANELTKAFDKVNDSFSKNYVLKKTDLEKWKYSRYVGANIDASGTCLDGATIASDNNTTAVNVDVKYLTKDCIAKVSLAGYMANGTYGGLENDTEYNKKSLRYINTGTETEYSDKSIVFPASGELTLDRYSYLDVINPDTYYFNEWYTTTPSTYKDKKRRIDKNIENFNVDYFPRNISIVARFCGGVLAPYGNASFSVEAQPNEMLETYGSNTFYNNEMKATYNGMKIPGGQNETLDFKVGYGQRYKIIIHYDTKNNELTGFFGNTQFINDMTIENGYAELELNTDIVLTGIILVLPEFTRKKLTLSLLYDGINDTTMSVNGTTYVKPVELEYGSTCLISIKYNDGNDMMFAGWYIYGNEYSASKSIQLNLSPDEFMTDITAVAKELEPQQVKVQIVTKNVSGLIVNIDTETYSEMTKETVYTINGDSNAMLDNFTSFAGYMDIAICMPTFNNLEFEYIYSDNGEVNETNELLWNYYVKPDFEPLSTTIYIVFKLSNS